MHSLSDYDYTLPSELIAQTPADPPESCRFLVADKGSGSLQDRIFSDITTLIDPDTLIVFNNSKVLKARLTFSPLDKGGLGGIGLNESEIFYLSSIDTHTFSALVRPGKRFKVGSTIPYNDEISFYVESISEDGRILTASQPIFEVLETYGQMPLPPYIEYDESLADPYQPVFASEAGSVAAPTASLHFSDELIQQLQSQGVQTLYTTLHVGLGTFKPVNIEEIKNYDIHAETIQIDNDIWSRIASHKMDEKPLLAVGTTVTRTLESLPYLWVIYNNHITCDIKTTTYRNTLTQHITSQEAKKCILTPTQHQGQIHFQSKLFLYPGRPLYIIDQLITNFHLPKSSLLMLVAATIGYDQMRTIYDHAIQQQYRFYSFGDAMWIKTSS